MIQFLETGALVCFANTVPSAEHIPNAVAVLVVAISPLLFYLHRHCWKLSIRALLTLVALLGIGLLWVRDELVMLLRGFYIQIRIDWESCIFLFVMSALITWVITLLKSSGLQSTEDQEKTSD